MDACLYVLIRPDFNKLIYLLSNIIGNMDCNSQCNLRNSWDQIDKLNIYILLTKFQDIHDSHYNQSHEDIVLAIFMVVYFSQGC